MKLSEVKADPNGFWLGPVQQIHTIGEYTFVEYERNGKSAFSIFVEGESISHGKSTLDAALAAAIAYKYDGLNSQASYHFMKMIGDTPDDVYLAHCKRAK